MKDRRIRYQRTGVLAASKRAQKRHNRRTWRSVVRPNLRGERKQFQLCKDGGEAAPAWTASPPKKATTCRLFRLAQEKAETQKWSKRGRNQLAS